MRVRRGGLATVRKVLARGGPVGASTVAAGQPLALKLWNEGDEDSLDQLQEEASTLLTLMELEGPLPCPRLVDLVGSPLVTGLVMEWCPLDMEAWWREKLLEPDAVGRLLAASAEVARRLGEIHAAFAQKGVAVAHGDLKPANVLLSADGRWLVTDFGVARKLSLDGLRGGAHTAVGTENFIPPEHLFHATSAAPSAADQWSLAVSIHALLRMRTEAMEVGAAPAAAVHSPRYRMALVAEVVEVFGRLPDRFRERPLDGGVFPHALQLPDPDQARVREALSGALGDPADEALFAEELLAVLSRALAVDPTLRFPSALALADALDRLVRSYLARYAGPSASSLPREDACCEGKRHELVEDLREATQEIERLQRREPAVRTYPSWRWWWGLAMASLLHAAIILGLVGWLSYLTWWR